jgi:hypothetical protein
MQIFQINSESVVWWRKGQGNDTTNITIFDCVSESVNGWVISWMREWENFIKTDAFRVGLSKTVLSVLVPVTLTQFPNISASVHTIGIISNSCQFLEILLSFSVRLAKCREFINVADNLPLRDWKTFQFKKLDFTWLNKYPNKFLSFPVTHCVLQFLDGWTTLQIGFSSAGTKKKWNATQISSSIPTFRDKISVP